MRIFVIRQSIIPILYKNTVFLGTKKWRIVDEWNRLRYIISDPGATLRANADALRAMLDEAGNDFAEAEAMAAALAAIEQALHNMGDM